MTIPVQTQRDLTQLLVKARNIVHSRVSRDQVLASLHAPSETVAQAVGRTAVNIFIQVVGSDALHHEVLLEAARYLIPELMDVGISAGIFPLKPPPDQGKAEGPGAGTDPYNHEIRMAMLEAMKVYGERQLKRPTHRQRAQNP